MFNHRRRQAVWKTWPQGVELKSSSGHIFSKQVEHCKFISLHSLNWFWKYVDVASSTRTWWTRTCYFFNKTDQGIDVGPTPRGSQYTGVLPLFHKSDLASLFHSLWTLSLKETTLPERRWIQKKFQKNVQIMSVQGIQLGKTKYTIPATLYITDQRRISLVLSV